jgi:hypothetical protein
MAALAALMASFLTITVESNRIRSTHRGQPLFVGFQAPTPSLVLEKLTRVATTTFAELKDQKRVQT